MSQGLLIFLIAIAGIGTLAVLIALFRSKKPLRNLLGSALQGLCALAAVDVLGGLTGVSLGLNLFTILPGILLGVPGIITLLLLKLIFAL